MINTFYECYDINLKKKLIQKSPAKHQLQQQIDLFW